MSAHDIQQQLALLPESLAEENIQAWQKITQFCELTTSHARDSRWQTLLSLIQKLSQSEQIKLYRGGLALSVLMISTKEKHGLEKGDAYLYVFVKNDEVTELGYRAANTEVAETFDCKNDEIFTKLQPLLGKLWNETRGKKNA